jgi:putative membrane protein
MSHDLGAFTDICGGCERIKNTPIPYSYASFIKKVILLFILTLPWSIAANLGFWSVLVVVFVMYAFASLEVIAEEIEEPFGFDANDLPTGKIAGNISRNVRSILGIE